MIKEHAVTSVIRMLFSLLLVVGFVLVIVLLVVLRTVLVVVLLIILRAVLIVILHLVLIIHDKILLMVVWVPRE